MGYSQILYPLSLLLPMCSLFADTLQTLKKAMNDGAMPPSIADEKRARAIFGRAVDLDRWLALEMTAQPVQAETNQEGSAP